MRAALILLAALGLATAAPQLRFFGKSYIGLEHALGGRIPVAVSNAHRIYHAYDNSDDNVVLVHLPGLISGDSSFENSRDSSYENSNSRSRSDERFGIAFDDTPVGRTRTGAVALVLTSSEENPLADAVENELEAREEAIEDILEVREEAIEDAIDAAQDIVSARTRASASPAAAVAAPPPPAAVAPTATAPTATAAAALAVGTEAARAIQDLLVMQARVEALEDMLEAAEEAAEARAEALSNPAAARAEAIEDALEDRQEATEDAAEARATAAILAALGGAATAPAATPAATSPVVALRSGATRASATGPTPAGAGVSGIGAALRTAAQAELIEDAIEAAGDRAENEAMLMAAQQALRSDLPVTATLEAAEAAGDLAEAQAEFDAAVAVLNPLTRRKRQDDDVEVEEFVVSNAEQASFALSSLGTLFVRRD